MNKNTVYILQKDYESPICKVHKGFRYTAKEWLRYFPKLSPEDFDIKTDWFKPKDDLQAVNSVRTEWWEEEIKKCVKSPYYFATNYLTVNDKPFTTPLNEKQFNSYFGMGNTNQSNIDKEQVNESKPVEQNPCNYCGKSLREQMNGCKEISCYRQHFKTEQFQWTDELAFEYATKCQTYPISLEEFKQSKVKKEEPIKVSQVGFIRFPLLPLTQQFNPSKKSSLFIVTTDKIPESKYQSIKEAIEGVLNGVQGQKVEISDLESFNRGYSTGWKDALKYNDEKYTEEELLQARRDAFNAARERIATYDGEQYFPTTKVKYKDNEDYINTLNK